MPNPPDDSELGEDILDDMLNDSEICDPNDADLIIPILKHHLNLVISKVRRITKMFRKSPTKNDILQNYVKEIRNGKELKLIIDCKTRWNSLLTMIERFLDLKKPLSKALIGISGSTNIEDYEWEILEDIQKSLKPIEIAVSSLCNRELSLLTAEGIFNFMYSQLEKNGSQLALNLFEALKNRIEYRRQKEIVILMKYL